MENLEKIVAVGRRVLVDEKGDGNPRPLTQAEALEVAGIVRAHREIEVSVEVDRPAGKE